MNELSLRKFVESHDYDIRKSKNGRFMDQKCIPDVVCAVAECVMNYADGDNLKTFTKNDIWHFDFSEDLMEECFSKPNTENNSVVSEYDKFFAQPLKMLAYAGVLTEHKEGKTNVYTVNNFDVLSFISQREKNALVFLDLYLTKVMKDSGCWDYFETFFMQQNKVSFNQLRDSLIALYKNNTSITKSYEPPRIFNKIVNILAFRRHKKGTVKGHLSRFPLTIDEIRYNRVNWRDIAKPKDMSRQEFAMTIEKSIDKYSGYYERSISKAKKFVRELEQYSEVHHYPAYSATDAHHIFMKSEFPELADMPENIIALTGTEHYSYAHPNRNTQRTDPNYQMICLISKLDSIERNFQEGHSDYSLSDFTLVLNEGLNTTEFNEQMGFEMIKARLLQYLRPNV